jgi:hypothetical protein
MLHIVNEQLLPSSSVATTLTSAPGLLMNMFGYCIQAVFTGAPVGSLQLQGSNDPGPNASYTTLPTNWANVGTATAISAAGVYIINMPDIYYNWVRVIYTPTSGTGTLTLLFNAKGF